MLIAVGLASCTILEWHALDANTLFGRYVAVACWLAGGTMIGAGLFALFKLGWLGGLIGFAIQSIILIEVLNQTADALRH
jgi:hypothetical protein